MTAAHQPDSVPSPLLVAAWERLGVLRPESVPMWAAYWIAAGYDGENLIYLAGLHGDDPREVHDSLPGALQDCTVPWPESDVAAAIVAFRNLAQMHLAGQAGPLWVAQKAEEVVFRSGYSKDVMALPLGQVQGTRDAWETGWGGTKAELAATVRKACEEQLAYGALAP
ncbi:MAG: hypothetical protein M3Z75_14740 [Actinomycetota bacterium]|nr:hypothetical protein [Actinomycetota bacterium]